ncbi:hypothetical protein ACPV5S_18065, partial [Vibrio astriarenae]
IVSPVVYEVHSNTSNQVAKLTMPLQLAQRYGGSIYSFYQWDVSGFSALLNQSVSSIGYYILRFHEYRRTVFGFTSERTFTVAAYIFMSLIVVYPLFFNKVALALILVTFGGLTVQHYL